MSIEVDSKQDFIDVIPVFYGVPVPVVVDTRKVTIKLFTAHLYLRRDACSIHVCWVNLHVIVSCSPEGQSPFLPTRAKGVKELLNRQESAAHVSLAEGMEVATKVIGEAQDGGNTRRYIC